MTSLEQLLESRDRRASFQRKLLEDHPGLTLLCLTVQLPGSCKRNAESLVIGGAGVAAILETFQGSLSYSKVRDLETGYEAYFLVSEDALQAKQKACLLEKEHPLGRLMDIDVIRKEGPVSREAIGLPPRKCLLCDREVRFCMRAGSHTTEQLLSRIQKMVKEYVLWNTEN